MAETVVHDHTASDSGSGIVLAVVVLLILAFLVIFGIPLVRNLGTSTTAPQINVPGQVDVNVKGTQ